MLEFRSFRRRWLAVGEDTGPPIYPSPRKKKKILYFWPALLSISFSSSGSPSNKIF
jgi:hypothetical protein